MKQKWQQAKWLSYKGLGGVLTLSYDLLYCYTSRCSFATIDIYWVLVLALQNDTESNPIIMGL